MLMLINELFALDCSVVQESVIVYLQRSSF